MSERVTAESRWNALLQYRSIYLRRAIDCSQLTIPSLIPESDQWDNAGQTEAKLPSLYQGLGAKSVNGLSAKLLLALYPPSQPFFRLVIHEGKLQEYIERQGGGGDGQEIRSRMDSSLALVERAILKKLDELQARPALFEAMKHLVTGGNALLHVGDDGIRMYGLRSFACRRDPEGNVVEIVLKERVARDFIPSSMLDGGEEDDDTHVDLYTWIRCNHDDDRCEWHQEYDGRIVPNTTGFSPLESSGWLCLRLLRCANEDFGRSLVEEAIGDLQSLESLSRAVVEGSLISAKAIALVNPNGVTRADVLARAENGAVVAGNAQDVEFLQVGKAQDMSVALQTMQVLERRLNFTFLNNEATTRDAERVTAEEIRLMAEQLEAGLGGIYSILAHELQLPLIRRILAMMTKAGEIPPVPPEIISPQITTGLDAIGRGNDKQRLTTFLQTIAASIGPEQFIQYIEPSELIRRFAAADGIETNGLVKDQQQLQAEQAQQQRASLEQSLTEGAIRNGATDPTQQQAAVSGGTAPVTPPSGS